MSDDLRKVSAGIGKVSDGHRKVSVSLREVVRFSREGVSWPSTDLRYREEGSISPSTLINRPGVARADLQTPLSMID